VVNQSTLRWNLLVFAILGMSVSQLVEMADASQGFDMQEEVHLQPLPLAGYDFTDSGSDAYGVFDLTFYGDAETIYDLQRGHVLQLGGTGSALAEDAVLEFRGELSICLWVKEGADCPRMNILAGQGWDETGRKYIFSVQRGDERYFEWLVHKWGQTALSAKHFNQIPGAVNVSDGQWHHIAVTYDANDLDGARKIYIDGQLDGIFDSLGAIDTSFSGLSVGDAFPGASDSFSSFVGWIDDVGFYDTALTPAEIQRIVINGLSGYNPELPVYVFPLDGAELAQNSLMPQWQAGLSSVSHNVYLSKDREAVAMRDPGAFLGNQTSSQIELTGLEWATTYHWRIDEVNEAHEDSPWLGPIWSFATLGTRPIDDIESYRITSPNRIFESWLDRWPYTVDGQQVYAGNGTGMTVGEYNEQAGGYLGSVDAAYEGWFSLPLEYDNTQPPYYSETQRNFEGPMNWTTNGQTDMAYLCMHHLGTVLPPSNLELSGDLYHVAGIWADSFETLDELAKLNKTDHCTFVSMPMQGDGAITVKVESVEDTAEWARAGIMIRESLAENARHMAVVVTPSNRAEYLYRQYPNGGTSSRSTGDPNSIDVPHWLRLTRQGSTLTATHSADGENWESLGVATIMMSSEVQVGLMVNSFVDYKTPCHAVFSNVQVNGSSDVTLETLTNIGRAINDPDHLYVAVQDVHEQRAVIVHPDDPNALLVDGWAKWLLPLSEVEAQGVDLSQITQLAIGVGDTPKAGEFRQQGGRGKFYVDQIRLIAEE